VFYAADMPIMTANETAGSVLGVLCFHALILLVG